MHTKDTEILGRLISAIEANKLNEAFPSDAPGSCHAIYLGMREIYRQRQPGQSPHPALNEKIFIDALDAWPMKDLLHFIKSKGNDFPKLVHESLLQMVDSTASLGADAVTYLVNLEVTLAQKRGHKPREDLITHFISSYGGRISLLRALSPILIEHFPKSEPIDAALAQHVPVHKMADQSFVDVSTSSDLMMAVHYPRTLRACLECLVESDSEYKFQFFRDHANGRMPKWALSMYVEVLGLEECLEQAGQCLRGSYRASMDFLEEPLRHYVEQFGAIELLNTTAMREDLESDERNGVTSAFFKWYASRLPYEVPEYTELAIPLVPGMIREDGKLPCSGFLIAWKQSRPEELFLAEFLESVSSRHPKKNNSSAGSIFRDFEQFLPPFDDSTTRHAPSSLVHGAFAQGASLNEVALTIRSVLAMTEVQAIGKVLPTLSSTALRGLCQLMGHTRHNEIMKTYPKASEFVMAVDLGL